MLYSSSVVDIPKDLNPLVVAYANKVQPLCRWNLWLDCKIPGLLNI